MRVSIFGGTFDQLFHRRCVSTFSIPWCKKVGALSRYSVIFCHGRKMAPIPPRPHQIRPIAAPAKKSEHRNRATRLAGTGVKESKACETPFVAKASSRAAVRVLFSHHPVLPRYQVFFPRSASCRRSRTADIGPPRIEEPASNRSSTQRSCEALRPWKIARPPLFFPTTKWRKKSVNSVTVHL